MSPIHSYGRPQLAVTVFSPILCCQLQSQLIQNGAVSRTRHSFLAIAPRSATPPPATKLFSTCTINKKPHHPNPLKLSESKGEDEKSISEQRRSQPIRTASLHSTPSAFLISALQEWSGNTLDLPTSKPKKLDLSWHDPLQPTKASPRNYRSPQLNESAVEAPRLSCATILATYLRDVAPFLQPGPLTPTKTTSLDKELLRTFNDKTLGYLSQRGYSAGDVMTWAWILTSTQPLMAAKRYTAFEESILSDAPQKGRIPTFVILFLLRRKNIDAEAFHLLLMRSWEVLHGHSSAPLGISMDSKAPVGPPAWNRSGDDTSIMIHIVRLIRLARRVDPTRLFTVAQLFTSMFGVKTRTLGRNNEKEIRRLTSYYNKCMKLLAVPCLIDPYRSIQTQHQAIFHLIGEMAEFKPPLAVTREGYQSIIRVLVSGKKTSSERRWADFKAQSWPPWKEDKLGIDEASGSGMEGSKSKAIEAMMHMKEAGYAWTSWEKTAAILAGWDTDGTPTVQTRTILQNPVASQPDKRSMGLTQSTQPIFEDYKDVTQNQGFENTIWAARIRATRTIKEAWACYLSYKDTGLHPSGDIYFEVAEKMIYSDYLQRSTTSFPSNAIPGDGKELSPEPTSPLDVIYVHTEPPPLKEFLRQLLSEGIKLPRRLLVLLLNHTWSIEDGMQYVFRSTLSSAQIKSLLLDYTNVDESRKERLSKLPDNIFAAFIRFLCRSNCTEWPSTSMSNIFPVISPPFISQEHPFAPQRHVEADETLAHAVFLIRLRMPKYKPAWHHLLSALATDRLPAGHALFPLPIQRLISWREITEVLSWMKKDAIGLDMKCFQIVCTAFTRLMLSIRKNRHGVERGMKLTRQIKDGVYFPETTSSEMVQDGLSLIKRHFDLLVQPHDSHNFSSVRPFDETPSMQVKILPSLSRTPAPAELHAFIRAVGLAKDFDGLLKLLRWMNKYENDLRSAFDGSLDENRLFRTAVVATRVYLEGKLDGIGSSSAPNIGEDGSLEGSSSIDDGSDTIGMSESRTSSNPRIQEAYEIIESSKLLSPWPSDREVDDYVYFDRNFV